MFYQKILLLCCLSFCSLYSAAKDPSKVGITWDVTASGFFSPEITELTVKKVVADSPAEKAGFKIGDKVISIENCEIPGCSASKAKSYLKSESGTKLHFVIEGSEGKTENIILTVG
ncbi:PDZ domain-containing protein [Pseudocolwellia agarivorans]|jgi:C-terminal processing protease CtpA/Prc|uniref:PDZ domain-containing protein n=1 Tax=Pseudocolwellia agarivorans TaxID=1911682 RepID=UPI003F883DCD